MAGVDPALLEALRKHRIDLARELGVPAYVVATNKTLEEIAARRPRSLEALGDVSGMGPMRVATYGEAILRRSSASTTRERIAQRRIRPSMPPATSNDSPVR